MLGLGEKSGGLTNMVLGLVALVILTAFVKIVFPDIAGVISDKMRVIVNVDPSHYEDYFR